MANETILSRLKISDQMFQVKTTKDNTFGPSCGLQQFVAGQFVMLSIPGLKNIERAYSIASPPSSKDLEFISIYAAGGTFSPKLHSLEVSQNIHIKDCLYGTLTLKNLLPGKRLWLLCTGTGVAPFLSILRDNIFQKFNEVILMHGVRSTKEVFYGRLISKRIIVYPCVSREASVNQGRVTDHIKSLTVFDRLNLPLFDKSSDRVAICGNLEFNKEIIGLLKADAWIMGSAKQPGHFIAEKAFVG
jgi:ferredoxin--NADP+ reductase